MNNMPDMTIGSTSHKGFDFEVVEYMGFYLFAHYYSIENIIK